MAKYAHNIEAHTLSRDAVNIFLDTSAGTTHQYRGLVAIQALELPQLRSYMDNLHAEAFGQCPLWLLMLTVSQYANTPDVREYARGNLMNVWRKYGAGFVDHVMYTASKPAYRDWIFSTRARQDGSQLLFDVSFKVNTSKFYKKLPTELHQTYYGHYFIPLNQDIIKFIAEKYIENFNEKAAVYKPVHQVHFTDGLGAAYNQRLDALNQIERGDFGRALGSITDYRALNMSPEMVMYDLTLAHLYGAFNAQLLPNDM